MPVQMDLLLTLPMRLWIGSFINGLKFALRSLRMFQPFDQIILLLKWNYTLGLWSEFKTFLALGGKWEIQGIILIVNIIIVIVTVKIF